MDRKDDLASQTLSLAGTFVHRGDFDTAIHYATCFCRLVNELAPSQKMKQLRYLPQAYRTLGRGYRSLGRWESATKSYQAALECADEIQRSTMFQEYVVIYNELANLSRLRGDFDEALD